VKVRRALTRAALAVVRGARVASAARVVLAVGVAAGCSADAIPDDALAPLPTMTPEEALFAKQVYPELQLTCAFCHAAPNNPVSAPQWMGFDEAGSYDRIVAYEGLVVRPESSNLLLKGEHTGPALTASQRAAVTTWLELEAKARGLTEPEPEPVPSPGVGGTVDEVLEAFGACMRFEDFITAKLDLLAYQQTTGWGPCLGCHHSGWGGAFVDDDAKLMFEQTRKKPFLLKYVGWELEGGKVKDVVQSNRMRDKGVEPCTYTGPDEALCHPKYVLLPQVDEAIDAFFKASYDRWKAANGACDSASPGNGGAGGGP
jgi:hypothetical protein